MSASRGDTNKFGVKMKERALSQLVAGGWKKNLLSQT
jgi:hypothetical protein